MCLTMPLGPWIAQSRNLKQPAARAHHVQLFFGIKIYSLYSTRHQQHKSQSTQILTMLSLMLKSTDDRWEIEFDVKL